jgi:NitT/TauT family transport system substrate-binding protein
MNRNSQGPLSRRSLLVGVAFVAAASALIFGPAIAQSKTKVRMAGINILSFSPMFVAKELGYFDAEGIDAEILETKGGNATTAAMLGGSADVISTGFASPLTLANQGKSVKALVGLEMTSVYAFVVKPDMNVPKDDIKALVAALKGKRLGVASLGSGADTVATGVLAEQGVGTGGVIKVATGTGGPAVAALKAGGVDAMITYEPDLTQILKAGAGKIALDLRSTKSDTAYGRLPATTIQATNEWIQKNPELAAGVVKAIVRANKTLQNDPETSVKVLSKLYEGTDPADVKSMYEGERASFRSEIPKDQYDAAHSIYMQQNVITKPVAYEDVVATQFAPLWK